ncbi:MAG: hypothetical protein K8L97_18985 [Anaerolineae bacterium]|nr:hypothetical protein [Anaerolineae bacterium]
MSVSLEWENQEKTAILIRYVSPWAWKQHYDMIRTLHDMMRSVNHPVDLIYDFRHGNALPPNALLHFMRGISQPRPLNTNRIVAVGADHLMASIGRILRRVYPGLTMDITETKTLTEARTLLGLENRDTFMPRSYLSDDNKSPIHHP